MTFKNKQDYLSFLQHRSVTMGEKRHWSGEYLREQLGNGVELTKPRMPLQDYAQYEDWKLWFERHVPFIQDGIVLVGYSLGGIFLAQYLSENKLPVHPKHVYLIAAPFDDELTGEDLVGGFELGDDLSELQAQTKKLTFMFSEDDETIPKQQIEKFRLKLPKAEYIVYESKGGHFRVEEFPELIEMIQADFA